MRHSDSLTSIFPALVDALAEIDPVAKDGANPAFKAGGRTSRYTTLEAVIEASSEVLHKHGLGLMQWPGSLADGALTLETVVIHKSGEWVSGDFQIALGKVDPQGVGSALTYARRYAQKAALNISDTDDDAEAAHGRGGRPQVDEAALGVEAMEKIDLIRDGRDVTNWKADFESRISNLTDGKIKAAVTDHYVKHIAKIKAANAAKQKEAA